MLKIKRFHVMMKVMQSHRHNSVMHFSAIHNWAWPVIWVMK